MQQLLQHHTPGDELEVRFYLDARAPHAAACTSQKHTQFKPVVEAILGKLGAHTRQKFIDVHVGAVRKRIVFAEHQRTEEWIEKVKKYEHIEPNDFGGFRVAVSSETAIEPRKIDKADRISLKYRYVYQRPGTRVEISAVKTCELSTVQSAKTRLLECNDAMQLWHWWDHWEFEVEYSMAPTLEQIYNWYECFAPSSNFPMMQQVRECSTDMLHPNADQFARISPRNTISRLLPKAVEPTLERWIDEYSMNIRGMVLRDKIDGTRELVEIRDGQLRRITVHDVHTTSVECDAHYLFDTERHQDQNYVLHTLVWRGTSVTHLTDTERQALGAAPCGLQTCPAVVIQQPLDVQRWWDRTTSYHRDGLIISSDEPYFQQTSLKWKPAEESTLDMLIVRCPEWLEGKSPFVRTAQHLYILNVGMNAANVVPNGVPLKRYLDIFHLDKNTRYVPQPFSPASAPLVYVWNSDTAALHGHIGEFVYCDGWQLRRLRHDKPSIMQGGTEIGNDIKTALDVWSKLDNPFPIQYVYSEPKKPSSIFDSMMGAITRVVAGMMQEETVTTAISHMLPFVPFTCKHSAALLPCEPRAEYTPCLANNSRIQQIKYQQLGKIELPKEFIGGAQLLVTMDPELLGHVSCIGKNVAPGGRLVVICKFHDSSNPHPVVGNSALMKDLERAGFELIMNHGAPADPWELVDDWSAFSVLSFRKENRGSTDMSVEEVHKENPHIQDNPEANFSFKFSRQKTKELSVLLGVKKTCHSLRVDAMLGELLVDVELLSTMLDGTQVLYRGTQQPRLQQLFPRLLFVQDATDENIEVVVSHVDYAESARLVETYKPHCGILDFTHLDLHSPVIKGRCMLHPYSTQDSTKVSCVYGRTREYWNITDTVFESEMMTFHRIYRPSAFKYAAKRANYDNCWDCRTAMYIITKYGKSQKISTDEAFSRF